jgi:hypothetical protein
MKKNSTELTKGQRSPSPSIMSLAYCECVGLLVVTGIIAFLYDMCYLDSRDI